MAKRSFISLCNHRCNQSYLSSPCRYPFPLRIPLTEVSTTDSARLSRGAAVSESCASARAWKGQATAVCVPAEEDNEAGVRVLAHICNAHNNWRRDVMCPSDYRCEDCPASVSPTVWRYPGQ